MRSIPQTSNTYSNLQIVYIKKCLKNSINKPNLQKTTMANCTSGSAERGRTIVARSLTLENTPNTSGRVGLARRISTKSVVSELRARTDETSRVFAYIATTTRPDGSRRSATRRVRFRFSVVSAGLGRRFAQQQSPSTVPPVYAYHTQ